MSVFVEERIFKEIINSTPLVSVDLLLVNDDKILLCKRRNNPAKGFYFTPGGRIKKNQSWKEAIDSILINELGCTLKKNEYQVIGVWDHFYENSFFCDNTSTHYLSIGVYFNLKERINVVLDNQHSDYIWINISEVPKNIKIHKYAVDYMDAIKEVRN